MRPSRDQLTSPIVPPGRQTRRSSAATTSWYGREHHAEHGQHAVEGRVAEGERLGVALDPVHVDVDRAGAGDVEERRHEVEAGDVGGDPRRAQGDVAGAGGDIEHRVGGEEADRAEEVVGRDAVDVLGHVGVAARRPDRTMLLFETRGG